MADRYLLETSAVDGYLLEDGTGVLLLDVQSAPVGLAAETDSALALGVARPVGLAAEADSALGLTAVQSRTAGLAAESASALALGSARPAGLAVEVDTAFAPGSARLGWRRRPTRRCR